MTIKKFGIAGAPMKTEKTITPRRSFIFTPGLKPEMFPKALSCGTDIVCVELEDGIAPQDKDRARKSAIQLFENDSNQDDVERILRINCIREKFGIDDVKAILDTDNDDVFVAKIQFCLAILSIL